MPYTPAYSAGDILTASAMNSVGDAWQSYGGNASLTGSVTNPTIGTGGLAGCNLQYQQINKVVHVRGIIIFGSGAAVGSGRYWIDMPVTARSTFWAENDPIGQCWFYDSSGTYYYMGQALWYSTTKFQFFVGDGLGTTSYWEANKPVALASGDQFRFTCTYEAA